MTEYASVEALTAPTAPTDSGMPEDDAVIEGKGLVRVRGLSRADVLACKGIDDRIKWEAAIIAKGMVIPRMTVEQVEAWQAASLAPVMEPAMDKIFELSGMDDGAERRAVREMVEDPDVEFRAVPGGSTQEDADGASEDAAG